MAKKDKTKAKGKLIKKDADGNILDVIEPEQTTHGGCITFGPDAYGQYYQYCW